MKASVYIGTSLDGFIARKDGDIDWLTAFASNEHIHAYHAFMSRMDVVLIGRGTFEKVLDFPAWPYDRDVFVLSSSIKQVPDAVKDKITILSMQPADVLQYLSRQGFSTVYVDGGKVIQSFLREGLINELIISKVPVLIGSGIPLFGHLDADIRFRHIRTEAAANGLVRSYYERS